MWAPVFRGVGTVDGYQLAVDPENDRSGDLEMNVRCPSFDRGFQNLKEHFHDASVANSRFKPNRKVPQGAEVRGKTFNIQHSTFKEC